MSVRRSRPFFQIGIFVAVGLCLSPITATAANSVDEYLDEGFNLKAVSESEEGGTTLWLQRGSQLVFCDLVAVITSIRDSDGNLLEHPATQMYPCTELVVDASIMREMQQNQTEGQ